MRIATFNLQNLRLRQESTGPRLQGAHDFDDGTSFDPALDVLDRKLTAAVLARVDADVACLQEVFDSATLDYFHDRFLMPAGSAAYPHRLCLPGNDGRGRNLAVLSRFPPDRVVSHATTRAEDLGLSDPEGVLGDGPVFRRDCLEIRFGALALFVCHLKAPYPDRARGAAIRKLEAAAIRRIIERAMPDPAAAPWMVLGDLNGAHLPDGQSDPALAPLLEGFAIDLMQGMKADAGWTFRMPGSDVRMRPDAMLASPELARRLTVAAPNIECAGLDPDAAQELGGIFTSVRNPRPHASDHCAIWIELGDWPSGRPRS